MRGTNYWGKSKTTGVTTRALLPGGPGEQTSDQPPGHRGDLRALPPEPSSGLFTPLSLAFSGERSGGFQGVGWDHRAAPAGRPAVSPSPGRRAFGFRKPSPHSPLASTSAPRPTAEATDSTAACGNSARAASHLARHKKTQELPPRAPSAQPRRRGPTPWTRPRGKPSTRLPDASPLFFF